MKNVRTIAILLLCAAGAATVPSCSKDFLNQMPQDELTSETYYRNIAEVDKGVIGCYAPLQLLYNGGNLAWTLGMISDEFSPWKAQSSVATSYNIDGFTKNLSYSQTGIWLTAYNNIQRCNRMIRVIGEKPFAVHAEEEALLKALLGEARFIRALNYFHLVQLYGDVPLVTRAYDDPAEAVGIGRTAAAKIYEEVILPDFLFAGEACRLRSKLPANQQGRVTSGAGYTLLAKAYLTLHRFADAEAALKKVVASGEYDLLPQVASIFDVANENHRESIFEVQYDEALEDGSTFNHWVGWEAAPFVNTTPSNESLWVSDSLVQQYRSTGDMERFNNWIVDSVLNPSTGKKIKDPYPKKLITTNTGLYNQSNNFIVTRYADVLLMLAEAVVMQSAGRAGEVVGEFNRIRTRAGLPALAAGELTLAAILNERRMELSFEGHRWYDLLRTGRAVPVMSAHLRKSIPAFQLHFPIPVTEIQKDPSLVQNPGY